LGLLIIPIDFQTEEDETCWKEERQTGTILIMSILLEKDREQ
jgi:hypothetical protein